MVHPALDFGDRFRSAISFPLEKREHILLAGLLSRSNAVPRKNIDRPGRKRVQIGAALELLQAPLVAHEHERDCLRCNSQRRGDFAVGVAESAQDGDVANSPRDMIEHGEDLATRSLRAVGKLRFFEDGG